ncbi:diguanylate cyclase [Photobacterium sp. GJ3]|uniref:diguanylate cyclase domain-containing protein n=1 Tax=Photobacterium sp. GJ3 TaxID=2829502 RepID=UPI001B8B2393|nr:diguanylate cyclase [Photobacterium sp. GJ3]QUJ68555.1 diguanylate cyclase [Photobacterium sp. GJ3]
MRNLFLNLVVFVAIIAPAPLYSVHLQQTQSTSVSPVKTTEVTYCFNPLWQPYEYLENGQHIGIFADYLRLFEQSLGIRLIPYFTPNWSEALVALQQGHCDFLPAISATEDRQDFLNFTQPYYQIYNVLVAKADKPTVTSFNSLAGKTIAGPQNTAVMTRLQADFPEIRQVYAATPIDAKQLLDDDKAYAFVTPLDALVGQLREDTFQKKIIAKLDFSLPISIGVRKDRPELLARFDDAIAALTPQAHTDISRKWTQITVVDPTDHSRTYLWATTLLVILLLLGIWILRLRDEIRQRSQLVMTLRHLANHDALTNLPTLRYGQEKLDEAIRRCHLHQNQMALLFVDLDGFKAVNDSFGHETGDQLLKAVAMRMLHSIRDTDTVVRIGGDEFILILDNISSNDSASEVADKILHLFQTPFLIAGKQIQLSASIGIAIYPLHGQCRETLLRHADQAMYRAKKNGKNQFQLALANLPELMQSKKA